MIPDFNNVYGEIMAPHGLHALEVAVRPLAVEGQVRVYTSGYDGSQTLRLQTPAVEMETTPLGGGCHLFNGGVGGTTADVVVFVEALSRALTLARIEHTFEVYDEEHTLLRVVPPVGEEVPL